MPFSHHIYVLFILNNTTTITIVFPAFLIDYGAGVCVTQKLSFATGVYEKKKSPSKMTNLTVLLFKVKQQTTISALLANSWISSWTPFSSTKSFAILFGPGRSVS